MSARCGGFGPVLPTSDLLLSRAAIEVPRLFVSDVDSTMIGQECIDELADLRGSRNGSPPIAERAMRGELDFGAALAERVGLLKGLSEAAIQQCLDERIRPMPGAQTLVATLKAKGCRTVLVTGGFHAFADPVAAQLGFEHVVGNRLGVHGGVLTGEVVGGIVDSSVKRSVLLEEMARLGRGGDEPCNRRRRERYPYAGSRDAWYRLSRQAQGTRSGGRVDRARRSDRDPAPLRHCARRLGVLTELALDAILTLVLVRRQDMILRRTPGERPYCKLRARYLARFP